MKRAIITRRNGGLGKLMRGFFFFFFLLVCLLDGAEAVVEVYVVIASLIKIYTQFRCYPCIVCHEGRGSGGGGGFSYSCLLIGSYIR